MRRGLHRPDRALVASLVVLAVVGVARAALATPESFLAGSTALTECCFTFVGSPVATALYVPLFAVGTSHVVGDASFSPRLVRRGSRVVATLALVPRLLACALAFSAVVLTGSLAALLLKSGNSYALGEIVGFCTLQLVFAALFFFIEGELIVAVQLLMGSSALAMAAAVLYGAFDTFLGTVAPDPMGTFWTGWMLVASGGPADPLPALSGAARLMTLVSLLGWSALAVARRADFTDGEGGYDE